VSGCCKHGDDPSVSMKSVEFLDWARNCELLKVSAPWI